ncbi:hypothetical protein OG373_25605 [Streptomyces avidinii]|uniref:hypothetical protein n=1 Tax=Streptomyces avidinii TaxID=1895 RepID=UPI00386E15B7|nr:hypothetical protein OG373_25605 [Streptomyces avidinii]
MNLLDAPSRWHVRLTGGGLVEVWADGYAIDGDSYVFDVLVTAPPEYRAKVEITARTPTAPERVCVAVARIPTGAVQELHTAGIGPDHDCACGNDEGPGRGNIL